jgi:hypothetical protein
MEWTVFKNGTGGLGDLWHLWHQRVQTGFVSSFHCVFAVEKKSVAQLL